MRSLCGSGPAPAHAGALRVGLAWAGNPGFIAATMKVCPLPELAPLLATAGCDFFSLQKGAAAADLQRPGPWAGRIADHTAELADFRDTAALVSLMDAVVSVDTSVAHLAGALARPLTLLLTFAADWRWLLEREDSPWYPTARLLRQRSPGDWGSVVEPAAARLRRLK